jgi:MIZ/SP-RING zinc finger
LESTQGSNRSYDDGDVRLVLRMLPCQPPQRPTGKSASKKALMRSDYHLWPKGTFMQIDHIEREIVQRKQQSHDVTEWSYLCRMLDVTQFVQTPATVTITGLFHDPDPYYLCVAICRYRAPQHLYRILMDGSINKLSREDSIQVALEHAKKNAVVCLDDSVENDNSSPSSFIFKLTCPISSAVMTTPVRGRQCNHFQCFDLHNFLVVNANVSGTRWECPVCNDEVISTYDLELCALTEKMLTQYKSEASLFRDRVQFFSDGTWKLMPEKRKRYSNTDANQSSSTCRQRDKVSAPDIVIL